MASWKVPGLGIVAQKANEHRLLVFFGLVTSISAALFEGGTVGLIAVGASVIINDSVEPIVLLVEPHSKVLSDVVSAYSPDKLFLLLILVAVSAQVFRFSPKERNRIGIETKHQPSPAWFSYWPASSRMISSRSSDG